MDIKEQKRVYYQTHKHIWEASYKRRHEKILQQKEAWRQKHKMWMRNYARKRLVDMKERLILHYGNGKIACVRCGFSDIRALSIDHIHSNGEEHRGIINAGKGRGSGSMFYRWLVKNNYPAGYQTLCMNCQFIKRHEKNECHRIN